LGVDVDNDSTITSLSVANITPVSIASGKTLSGAITVTAGSLKLTEAGTLASSVSMSGGVVLDADESSTVSGALSHTADITIDVADNKTLTYSGSAISVGANTITLSGGGSLISGGLTLNNANSKLLLNSITVDSVSTTIDNSLGVDVDNNSTITSLSVANITPVSIASGKSLSGAITVTAGSLKLNETGTLASSVSMSGGTLDADETSTVSGALTQAGNISIDVADNKTLTFSTGEIKTESHQLTLAGEGTIAFPSNASGIVLNNAAGLLKLDGTGTLGAAKVTAVSNAGKGLAVNASSTISSLKVAANTELNVAQSKTLSGSTEVAASKTLNLSGTGTFGSALNLLGTLKAGANLTVSGLISVAGNSTVSIPAAGTTLTYSGGDLNVGSHTLSIGGAGTFSNATGSPLVLDVADSILSLTGNGTISGPVKLESGTLKSTGSPTVSGAMTQYSDATIEVSTNQTLTYSGAPFSLGANTLTLTGGGTLVSGGLYLNNASSKLLLNSITLDNVSTSANSLGLDVDNNSTITALSVANITPVSIASGSSLLGGITVSAGSLKLSEAGTLASTISMSGGVLDADESSTVSGALSHSADITIDVADNKTLTYSGAALNLGANTLTLSGEGRLSNSYALVLNNASSKLLLSNSITVDSVRTSLASLGLDVDNNSTVSSLTVGHTTPVSIVSGRTLSGAITVTAGSIKLDEAGELASTIAMSGGVLDADESSTVSGALSHTADITIDVADNKTLTYSGAAISLGANTLTLTGGGTLVSGGLTLNDPSSKLLLNSITVDNVSTSANNLGLDVDNNSTVTSLSVGYITPVSIASGKSLSGAITVSAGSLKLNETGTLASTIAMSGGVLDADNSSTVSGALSHTADITIDVADNKTLTYTGAPISLGANTLTLSGGGSLVSGGLTLDNASSKLVLNSITVDNVSTTSDSLGLDVDNNSTITALSVGHITPVSIASSRTLSGGITVTAGSIKLDEAGTLASTVSMSGGTLDADESLTLSGALTQSGNITIDVADNKTLTYSGAAVNLGAYTLKMSGGGTLSNTYAFALNHASSKLQLNSITVGKVSTSKASLGLDVDANSTVSSLTVGHATPVSIASSITLSGAIAVTAGSIKLDEAGTLGSTVTMSGGTLDADNSSTLSGALTQSGAIEIDVASSKTLTYSGAAVNLGAYTLTMSGGGTLSNTNAFALNHADSKLLLNSITVAKVSTSANNSGLDVNADSTVTSLTVANTTPVSIASSITLSGGITVSAGSIKLGEAGTLGSTVTMSGGKLDVDETLTVSGALTQSGAIEIDVASGEVLTYSGAAVNLGAYTLKMSGGGTLSNTYAFALNHGSSKLLLNSITVAKVSTSAVSLGLDVDDNSTVSSLTVGHLATPVSIADGITLSGGIAVTAGSIKLGEAGTLGSTVTMSGGTTLDVDDTLTISGTLTQSGAIEIDVASGEVLTYSGAAVNLGAYTLKMSGGGTLSNTYAFALNHASSKLQLNSITVAKVSTSAV